MRIVLLGPPGAGKGTQAKTISETLAVIHVASGDLLRENQNKGTELGEMARGYMQKGLLVPDDVIIGMIQDRISNPDATNGYVLDGFPRTLEQASSLDAALSSQNQHIDKVLNIKVSDSELIVRLSGRWICRDCQRPYHETNSKPKKQGMCDECNGELYQREDDTSDAVSKRIQVYSNQTAPLIEYYKERGNLVEINGEQSIEDVRKDLLETIS
ncbi:MAG: adenylate kinase [Dehalococcoidia bacterium]|nr:adenylate kinase [Chloroflexota bacterium]MCH2525807.1 adenylate kinase [Dehalococcoidia bacterium]MQF99597.1 adenylate kinase [SAR202 cluster bacterium]|tara:strand:+ start:121 stop:762 length:642 start_codon:yes stop_codon:yes gene_type:complete